MALNIVSGNRPPRPSSLTADQWLHDRIWDAIQRCWAVTPQSRPPINSLHRELAKLEQEEEKKPANENGRVNTASHDSLVDSFSKPTFRYTNNAHQQYSLTPRTAIAREEKRGAETTLDRTFQRALRVRTVTTD